MTRAHILICRGPDCTSRGSQDTYTAFARELEALGGGEDEVVQTQCGCVGPMCGAGPTVCVYPDGVWYGGVTADDVPEIVTGHIAGGTPVQRLVAARLGGDTA
ncbi:MAG: (2Fe-2S) ferredoxin domain-containing protein [Miltoncostaeaceae bacterium]